MVFSFNPANNIFLKDLTNLGTVKNGLCFFHP